MNGDNKNRKKFKLRTKPDFEKKYSFHPSVFLREFHGKKYQYGGEYPYNKPFLRKVKNIMNGNGYDIYYEKKNNGNVIIWTRRI